MIRAKSNAICLIGQNKIRSSRKKIVNAFQHYNVFQIKRKGKQIIVWNLLSQSHCGNFPLLFLFIIHTSEQINKLHVVGTYA